MAKTISIGKKKIMELLELPQFADRTLSWAYTALRRDDGGTLDSDQAREFREYVLSHCHGVLITKKRF